MPITGDSKINGLGAFLIFFSGTHALLSQLGRSFSARTRYWPQVREVGCLGYCVCLGLRSASESPCSACLTPYTQTCPACLPVLVCLLYVLLLLRMLDVIGPAYLGI